MPEGKKQEKKEEGKIILLTSCMHCAGCRYKLYKILVAYPGVEDVNINFKENKVTLKAPKVDAINLFESVKKKSKGMIRMLVYPDPSSKEKEKQVPKDKKPVEVTVVLKVMNMNCSPCTRKVEKAAWKIDDVQSVKVQGEILTIKGLDLDPAKVCKDIIKKSRKFAEVVPPKKKDDEKKGHENKDAEKKDDNINKVEKEAPLVITYVYPVSYCFSEENPNACSVM